MNSSYKNTIEILDLKPDGFNLVFLPSNIESSADGHTWSLIIKAHCISEKTNINDIIFDPESDMFSALSNKKKSLEKLAIIIDSLINNHLIYEKALAGIETVSNSSDEDMTTEEYLEYMKDIGLNMSVKHTFEFMLDSFDSEKQAIVVKKILEGEGYSPKFEIHDDDIYFSLVLQLQPIESEVNKIESLLNRVSVMHGVEYIGFGVDNT